MPDPPSRPPIAPALPEVNNTIAFGLTKKAALLASLRSKHRASQPTATTTTSTKKGFSSLTTSTTPLPVSTTSTPNPHQSAPPNDDLDSSFRIPPNAGVGQAPPSTNGAVAAQDAETRQLARKILGRNAARQVQEAREARGAGGRGVKRRGGVAEESESEEELGRSAVGRARVKGGGKVGGRGGQKEAEREEEQVKLVVDAGGNGGAEVAWRKTEDEESVPRGDDEDKPKKKKRKKSKGTTAKA